MTTDIETYLSDGCDRCALGGTPDCKIHQWIGVIRELRRIILTSGLTEEMKWGVPCYTHKGNNVLVLSALKEYATISFFKGVLLQDAEGILEKPGENTQSARLIKCTTVAQVLKLEATITAYIYEAIEVENAGIKPEFKQKDELEYPEELQEVFAQKPELEEAFEALTPGRKRGYVLHFSQPKQSQTRTSRIIKCIPKIMEGKGFHDR